MLNLVLATLLIAAPLTTPGALTTTPAPAAADCLDGVYDLGEQAAALAFSCNDGQPGTAEIAFCRRRTYLGKGYCTGQNQPIACQWKAEAKQWLCDETGNYPFHAELTRTGENTLRYVFQSSFNSGTLSGKRFE